MLYLTPRPVRVSRRSRDAVIGHLLAQDLSPEADSIRGDLKRSGLL